MDKDASSTKIVTGIWQEIPSEYNPYIAKEIRLHGYDMSALLKQRSFIDVLFLLFIGELPTKEQSRILELLMIANINPGPRHPANRATINSGISKTNTEHILPIGLMVLGGAAQGAAEVKRSIEFLKSNIDADAKTLIHDSLKSLSHSEGDKFIAPGFGSMYGEVDHRSVALANYILEQPGAGKYLNWGNQFASYLKNEEMGWLVTGVVAATLLDLGFGAREGAGLFQIMCAPGLLAHGLEQTHKPLSSMPILGDESYIVQTKK